MSEKDYERGWQSAYRQVLQQAMMQLPRGDFLPVGLVAERGAAVAALREVCRDHGDLDWSGNLHLADVIEKHLRRHLDGQREAVRAEVQGLRNHVDALTKQEADVLHGQFRLAGQNARLTMKNRELSKQVADLEAARLVDRPATDSAVSADSDIDGGARGSTPPAVVDPGGEDLPQRTQRDLDGMTPEETTAWATEQIREHYARQMVQIEVPIGPPVDEDQPYPPRVDIEMDYPRHRAAMWRLFTGLNFTGARMADTSRVTNQTEAVLWLIEQLAQAVEKRDGAER